MPHTAASFLSSVILLSVILHFTRYGSPCLRATLALRYFGISQNTSHCRGFLPPGSRTNAVSIYHRLPYLSNGGTSIKIIKNINNILFKIYCMNWLQFLGYFGAFLTCITFVPQVYQSYKTKSVGDLSTYTILIVITSTIVWLTYGIGISEGPVIVANAIMLCLTLILFYFKLTYKK